MGFGFSAGAIDYVLNFFADNTDKPLLLLLVGVAYGGIYYFVFSFFIKRFNLATPGRGGAEGTGGADWILPESQRGPAEGSEDSEASEATGDERDRDDVLAENALAALGGRENVESVEGCITRLRCVVSDPEAVNENRLKELGASGVIKRGQIVQVVMGTQSDRIADRMNRQLKTEA
jgi:PTS system N-acetylglucosamine-specific IIC component